MYREYFEIQEMPFSNTVDRRYFYRTAEHEEALAALVYGATQRRGMTVITGRPGCGKSLLGMMLIEALGHHADCVYILHTPENGHELFLTLCRELGIRCRNSHSSGELIERLRGYLESRSSEDRRVVVLLDEAHRMSEETLEQLRILSNLEKDSAKLLQIVLLGHPELYQMLQQPSMEQLRQRIYCCCRLTPLKRDQTRNYIHHRLQVAGAKDADLFDDEAVGLIHDRSGGLPRLINQIADSALLAAFSKGRRCIDRDIVAGCLDELIAAEIPQTDASAMDSRDGNKSITHEQPPAPAPAAWPGVSYIPAIGLPVAPADGGNHHQNDPTEQRLGDSIRRGAELIGRLDEAARYAARQADQIGKLLAGLNETTGALDSARHDAASCGKNTQAMIENLQAQAEQAEQQLQQVRQVSDEIKAGIDAAGRMLTQLKESRVSATAEFEQYSQQAENFAHRLEGKIQQIDQRIEDAETATRLISEQYEQQAGNLDRKIEQADALCIRLTGQTQERIGALQAATEQADALTQKLQGHTDTLEQFYNERTLQARKTIQQLNDIYQQAATLCGSDVLADLDSRQDELQTLLEGFSTQYRELCSANELAESLCEQVANTAQKSAGYRLALHNALAEARQHLDELQQSIEKSQKRIDTMSADKDRSLEEMNEGLQVLALEQAQLQEWIERAGQSQAELDRRTQAADARAVELHEWTTAIDTRLAAVKEEMAGAQKMAVELRDLQNRLGESFSPAVQQELADRQVQLQALLTRLTERQGELARAVSEADEICRAVCDVSRQADVGKQSLQEATDIAARQSEQTTQAADEARQHSEYLNKQIKLIRRIAQSLTRARERACRTEEQCRQVRAELTDDLQQWQSGRQQVLEDIEQKRLRFGQDIEDIRLQAQNVLTDDLAKWHTLRSETHCEVDKHYEALNEHIESLREQADKLQADDLARCRAAHQQAAAQLDDKCTAFRNITDDIQRQACETIEEKKQILDAHIFQAETDIEQKCQRSQQQTEEHLRQYAAWTSELDARSEQLGQLNAQLTGLAEHARQLHQALIDASQQAAHENNRADLITDRLGQQLEALGNALAEAVETSDYLTRQTEQQSQLLIDKTADALDAGRQLDENIDRCRSISDERLEQLQATSDLCAHKLTDKVEQCSRDIEQRLEDIEAAAGLLTEQFENQSQHLTDQIAQADQCAGQMMQRLQSQAAMIDQRIDAGRQVDAHLAEQSARHQSFLLQATEQAEATLAQLNLLFEQANEIAGPEAMERLNTRRRELEQLLTDLTEQARAASEHKSSVDTQRARLAVSIQEAVNVRDRLQSVSSSLDSRLAELHGALEESDRRQQTLTATGEKIHNECNTAGQQLSAYIETAHEISGQLQSDLVQAEQAGRQLHQEIDSVRNDGRQVVRDLANQQDAISRQSQAFVDKLQEIIGFMEQRATQAGQSIDAHIAAGNEQTDRLGTLLDRADEREKSLDEQLAQARQLGEQLMQTGANAGAQLDRRITEANQQADALLKGYQEKADKLQSCIEQTRQAAADFIEIAKKQSARLQDDVRQADEAARRLQQEGARQNESIDARFEKVGQLTDELAEQVRTHSDTINNLTQESQKSAQATHVQLDRQAQAMRERCEKLTRLAERLFEQSGLQLQTLDRRLQQVAGAADEIIGELDQRNTLLQSQMGEAEKLTDRLDSSCRRADELCQGEQLDNIHNQLTLLRRTLESAQAHNRQLDERIRVAGDVQGPLQATVHKAESLRQALADTAASAQQVMTDARDKTDQATQQLNTLDGQLKNGRTLMNELDQARESAETTHHQCGQQTRQLNEKLDQAGRYLHRFQNTLDTAEQTRRTLEEQIDTFRETRRQAELATREMMRERVLAEAAIKKLVSMRRELVNEALKFAPDLGDFTQANTGQKPAVAAERSIRALDALREAPSPDTQMTSEKANH